MYQDILFRKPEVLSWLFWRKEVGSVNRQKGNGSMIGHSFKIKKILQSCRKKKNEKKKKNEFQKSKNVRRRNSEASKFCRENGFRWGKEKKRRILFQGQAERKENRSG